MVLIDVKNVTHEKNCRPDDHEGETEKNCAQKRIGSSQADLHVRQHRLHLALVQQSGACPLANKMFYSNLVLVADAVLSHSSRPIRRASVAIRSTTAVPVTTIYRRTAVVSETP